jgi:serine/threonine protein phosphatase PrpC
MVADGMGGKSGGRKAADQVLLTGRPDLRALRARPGRRSRIAAPAGGGSAPDDQAHRHHGRGRAAQHGGRVLHRAGLVCDVVHAGDSRVYHFRGAEMMRRTVDHSFVQRLIDEGKITEEAANTHPQSNLLTGCLGTHADPPVALWHIDKLEFGDTMLACSDGLWHYFTPKEIGAILHALPPREASEMLVSKARQRARGGGDNLSLALGRIDPVR